MDQHPDNRDTESDHNDSESESAGSDTSDDDTSEDDSDKESLSDNASDMVATVTTTAAGVSRDRREAKRRKQKPINALIDLVKEARKPNRQHKGTAPRLLVRLVESNRTMQHMRQQMVQIRAKRR